MDVFPDPPQGSASAGFLLTGLEDPRNGPLMALADCGGAKKEEVKGSRPLA